jgi:hypothetical protein
MNNFIIMSNVSLFSLITDKNEVSYVQYSYSVQYSVKQLFQHSLLTIVLNMSLKKLSQLNLI